MGRNLWTVHQPSIHLSTSNKLNFRIWVSSVDIICRYPTSWNISIICRYPTSWNISIICRYPIPVQTQIHQEPIRVVFWHRDNAPQHQDISREYTGYRPGVRLRWAKQPGSFTYWTLPSSKRLHNYGKSSFWIGTSTISMAIFNSFLYVYQRVSALNQAGKNTITSFAGAFSS